MTSAREAIEAGLARWSHPVLRRGKAGRIVRAWCSEALMVLDRHHDEPVGLSGGPTIAVCAVCRCPAPCPEVVAVQRVLAEALER